jgi:electron transfer flavoprotein beta subunit
MEIAVLVKPVPEAETRLRANAARTALDPQAIKWVLAGYDESAVEQALLLREAVAGSHVRAFSFGPAPRSEEVLRASLALGCDAATWLEHPTDLEPDPLLAGRALATALGTSPWDLILCGKQAGDDEAGLVASVVGEVLQLPSFGAVTDLRWEPGGSRFRFQRPVEGGVETVESPAHLVVGLQQAWNDPRTAKLPNILKSRKAPIDKVGWAETAAALGAKGAPGSRSTGFRLPVPRTGARMIEYKTPEEAAQKLVAALREEAKVFP